MLFLRVSSTNKTDCHDITDILLKMALNTISSIYTHVHNKVLCHSIPPSYPCLMNCYIVVITYLRTHCSQQSRRVI